MSVLPAQLIYDEEPLRPMVPRARISTPYGDLSYGLGSASYDIRIAHDLLLLPGEFALASSIEEFNMPHSLSAQVLDKSTWARRGLSLFNTWIDPGWRGFLTLEMVNHGKEAISLTTGWPIAQIVFFVLEEPTKLPYQGKYQNQEAGPVSAR